jgi:predicted nucleic acid-binding protein
MLKVVSNTTPILSLLQIDHLHLLGNIFEKVIVPFGRKLSKAVLVITTLIYGKFLI